MTSYSQPTLSFHYNHSLDENRSILSDDRIFEFLTRLACLPLPLCLGTPASNLHPSADRYGASVQVCCVSASRRRCVRGTRKVLEPAWEPGLPLVDAETIRLACGGWSLWFLRTCGGLPLKRATVRGFCFQFHRMPVFIQTC